MKDWESCWGKEALGAGRQTNCRRKKIEKEKEPGGKASAAERNPWGEKKSGG